MDTLGNDIRALTPEEVTEVSGGDITKTWDGKAMLTANMWFGDKTIVISATDDWHSCTILKGSLR